MWFSFDIGQVFFHLEPTPKLPKEVKEGHFSLMEQFLPMYKELDKKEQKVNNFCLGVQRVKPEKEFMEGDLQREACCLDEPSANGFPEGLHKLTLEHEMFYIILKFAVRAEIIFAYSNIFQISIAGKDTMYQLVLQGLKFCVPHRPVWGSVNIPPVRRPFILDDWEYRIPFFL